MGGNTSLHLLGIKGAEFSFGNKASVQIGTPILIPVIVGAVILSAITAYGVYKIIEIINITKQVLSNNDLQKFMADYKLRVAQSGIPQAEKDRLTKSAEATEKAAQDNNKKLTDDTTGKDGVLDKITNLVLISGGLFLVSKFIK